MGGVCRVRPRHDDEPNPGAQSSLIRPHNISQAAANTVSRNGGTNMFRRDEPGSEELLLLYLRRPENQITTTLSGPLPFHARELG